MNTNKSESGGICFAGKQCNNVKQAIFRYTDGYESWLERTNILEMTDCDCLAVASNDIQILIKRIAELEAQPKD